MTSEDSVIALDATVLSNFAYSDSLGILLNDDRAQPVTTRQVVAELRRGVNSGHSFLQRTYQYLPVDDQGMIAHIADESPELPVETAARPDASLRTRLFEQLDSGEASVIYLSHIGIETMSGPIAFASDCIDARRIARGLNVPVTGSIGLLVRAIHQDRLSTSDAETIHTQWVDGNQFYSPVDSISSHLEDL